MIHSRLKQIVFEPQIIKLIEFGLLVFLAIALYLKFRLIFKIAINQDEFAYLSRIYSFSRGSLTQQFQTFHVHFFKWIFNFSKNEAIQIIFARSAMYLFFLGTCLLTYLIGRQFLNRSGALFAVICFLSFSYVIVNGSSFRSDTISAFFSLLSTYLIISKTQSRISIIIAGLAFAVSLMVTIKSVFHLISIGIIFICILIVAQNKLDVVKKIICFFITLATGCFLFYHFHASTLLTTNLGEPNHYLGRVSSKVIITNELFPGWKFLKLTIYLDLFIWILFVAGIILVTFTIIHTARNEVTNRLILLAFLFPIFSLIFYRNAFPYFYVFILSPAIIFCGVVSHEIIEVLKKTTSVLPPFFLIVLTLIVFLNFLRFYLVYSPNRNVEQVELLEHVHEIFPEPVSYIDGCSMVASYPNAGFFMSSWGMENYLRTNKPIMKDLLIKYQPLFLLANVPQIDLSLPKSKAVSYAKYSLLEDDWMVLKSNFLHHWGPIYVVGKQFDFSSVVSSQIFNILISGEYTLEGKQNVLVDGLIYRPGDIITLKKGKHTITGYYKSGKVALRWGKHLYKPSTLPPSDPIFFGVFL